MTEMRFDGELATRVWTYVKDHLDLLEDPRRLDSVSDQARRETELKLITFLGLMGFGEEDVRQRRGTGRREYFEALYTINPDIFLLHVDRREIKVVINLECGTKELYLGRACGYTTLVPLTYDGYWEYMMNKVSAFQFGERHIARLVDTPTNPCFIYGEGAFHLSYYANPKHFPEGTVHATDPQPEWTLLRSLKVHVRRFLPRLQLTDADRVLESKPVGHIPVFIFADNGVVAKGLVNRGFTDPPGTFPIRGIAGYPRYVLDLADYNRPEVDTERKKAIYNLMNLHLDLTKETDMTNEPFSDKFVEDVFSNAALLDFYSRNGSDAFKGIQIACILHFLRDLVPFFEALVRLGAAPEKMTFFYKKYPYPQRQSVQDYLRKHGAVVAALEDLEAWLSQQEVSDSDHPLVVIEDGGYITPRLLSSDLPRLRARTQLVVEQTTRGRKKIEKAVTRLNDETPSFPILSVASCKVKGELEPAHIARSFVQNLQRLLPDRMLAGSSCGLLGFGAIGREVANTVHHAGARVTVFDANPLQRTKARQMGYQTESTKEGLLAGRDWVIGCTGDTSVTEDDIYLLTDGTYLVSASSDQIEFAVEALERHSDRKNIKDFEVEGKLVGRSFELRGTSKKRVVLLANGFPLNFWGMNSMPDSLGDLIMTVLLLAALKGLNAKPQGVDSVAVDGIVSAEKLVDWFDQKYQGTS